eukprot:scaffold25488_cov64-Phaeocystis_antarctica.AAC.7
MWSAAGASPPAQLARRLLLRAKLRPRRCLVAPLAATAHRHSRRRNYHWVSAMASRTCEPLAAYRPEQLSQHTSAWAPHLRDDHVRFRARDADAAHARHAAGGGGLPRGRGDEHVPGRQPSGPDAQQACRTERGAGQWHLPAGPGQAADGAPAASACALTTLHTIHTHRQAPARANSALGITVPLRPGAKALLPLTGARAPRGGRGAALQGDAGGARGGATWLLGGAPQAAVWRGCYAGLLGGVAGEVQVIRNAAYNILNCKLWTVAGAARVALRRGERRRFGAARRRGRDRFSRCGAHAAPVRGAAERGRPGGAAQADAAGVQPLLCPARAVRCRRTASDMACTAGLRGPRGLRRTPSA